MQGQTGEDLPILNYSAPWAFEVSNSMIFIYWISDYWLLRQRQDIDRKGSNFVNHKNFWLLIFFQHIGQLQFESAESAFNYHYMMPRDTHRQCSSFWRAVVLKILAETMRMRGPLLSRLDFWQPPGGLLWSAMSTMTLPVCSAETSLDSCLPLPDLLSRIRPDFFR